MFGYSEFYSVLIFAAFAGGLAGLVMGARYAFTEAESTLQMVVFPFLGPISGALVFLAGTVVAYSYVAPLFLGIIEFIKSPGMVGTVAVYGSAIGAGFGLFGSYTTIYQEQNPKGEGPARLTLMALFMIVMCTLGGLLGSVIIYFWLRLIGAAFTT